MILSEKLTLEEDYVPFIQKLLKQVSRPAIFAIDGALGAGKTTFTAYFCRHFGLNLAQSPTFSIHNRYQNSEITIDHFDLYRLETEDEIEASGFYDLLHEPADFKMVEWAERVQNSHWPIGTAVYKLQIQMNADQSRTLSCERK